MAEEGIAAWKYKDGPVSAQDEQRLAGFGRWWSGNATSAIPTNFFTLKVDLYPEEVYTFTEKLSSCPAMPLPWTSHIAFIPRLATVGAKVNGRMVPRRKLPPAILLRSSAARPQARRDWLGLVSPRARNKIKHWLIFISASAPSEIGAN